MKRFARYIQNALTLLSILLFLTTALLWERSHREPDQVRWGHAGKTYWQFDACPGVIICNKIDGYWRNTPATWTIPHLAMPRPPRAGKYLPVQRFDDDQFILWSPSSYRGYDDLSFEQGTCSDAALFISSSSASISPPAKSAPYSTLVLPYWLIASLAASLPLSRLALLLKRRHRRAARLAQSLCPSCGYDLRATPDRCPECGTVSPPSPAR